MNVPWKLLVSAISDCDVVKSVFAVVIVFFKKIVVGIGALIHCVMSLIEYTAILRTGINHVLNIQATEGDLEQGFTVTPSPRLWEEGRDGG
jgi:hypothetical protein